jgi:hypothetical protein
MLPPIHEDILSAQHNATPSFLNLPGEIRNTIYKMVLLQPGGRKRGRRRRFRGCTKILRLNKQIYAESHWLLHDAPQVLDLPVGDGILGRGPAFRFWKTKYKRSKGNPRAGSWGLVSQPKALNSAVDKFTALEFRTFSNVTLQIEYCDESVPTCWLESTHFECQEHALRVLMGSKSLETLTLSLRKWNTSSGSGLELQNHNKLNLLYAFHRLLPFTRLGGVDTKIVVENVHDDSDLVVSLLNLERSLYVQNPSLRPVVRVQRSYTNDLVRRHFNLPLESIFWPPEDHSFPPQSSRSYISFDNMRFLKVDGGALCDIRKLFDYPSYLRGPTEVHKRSLFKCKECFVVYQSKGDLTRHMRYSLHYAKAFLHNPEWGPYERFCRHYHGIDFHFKRKPNSAFKCSTCLSKFSFYEGLQNHQKFWGHSGIREGDVLGDIRCLFGEGLNAPERRFQGQKCGGRFRTRTSRPKHGKAHRPHPVAVNIKRTWTKSQCRFKCLSCRASFGSKTALISHEEREGRSRCHTYPRPCLAQTLSKSQISNGLLCHCVNCGEAFDHQADLLHHIKKVNASRYAEPDHFISLYHKDIPFTHPTGIRCPACKQSFPSINQLNIHLTRNPSHRRRGKGAKLRFGPFSKVPVLPVESESWFHCRICSERFETRNLLQRHIEHVRCFIRDRESQ